ncbi:hypothetical protein FIBSPDRAFT_504344 [Athelia psychrophila]|uniref:Uncharacterized protein n=1 Tax=Athelia psychrophila TaxID=1759441 RepID=A0A166K6X0_9AGAM|nr:hypothetical protein FIBSPDRAFT_504344 [Fibularhizoctonia sp. CBS 109695]
MVKSHESYLSKLDPSQTVSDDSPPAFYLDYDRPDITTTSFNFANLKLWQKIMPFPVGTAVHKDWLRSISAIALPVLVRLPRSTNPQVMTATVHIPDLGSSRADNMPDPTLGVGVRWLHCK